MQKPWLHPRAPHQLLPSRPASSLKLPQLTSQGKTHTLHGPRVPYLLPPPQDPALGLYM